MFNNLCQVDFGMNQKEESVIFWNDHNMFQKYASWNNAFKSNCSLSVYIKMLNWWGKIIIISTKKRKKKLKIGKWPITQLRHVDSNTIKHIYIYLFKAKKQNKACNCKNKTKNLPKKLVNNNGRYKRKQKKN